MSTGQVRVSPQWLSLREPADAQARSRELAAEAARDSADPADGSDGSDTADGSDGSDTADGASDSARARARARARATPMMVHDLGSGSGSMGRWLAPRLRGPQHWVLHDRDPGLLRLATAYPPPEASDGATVTVETLLGDLTKLRPEDLAGASLITASALLDMLTGDELERLVRTCVAAARPALITLSVTGRVRLTPPDAMDSVMRRAFNDHQRRTTQGRTLLGPAAARAAVHLFRRLGSRVEVRASPWLLDSSSRLLLTQWLDGWVAAAAEQRPDLVTAGSAYLARRSAELDQDGLTVTVQHIDLLARPPGARR